MLAPGPISFIFMQFSEKILSNNRFLPETQGSAPRLGNPGSVTVNCHDTIHLISTNIFTPESPEIFSFVLSLVDLIFFTFIFLECFLVGS